MTGCITLDIDFNMDCVGTGRYLAKNNLQITLILETYVKLLDIAFHLRKRVNRAN